MTGLPLHTTQHDHPAVKLATIRVTTAILTLLLWASMAFLAAAKNTGATGP